MHSVHQRPRLALAVALLSAAPAFADPAAFDLAGPSLEAEVTHGTATLPIAQVPNLSAGDRVWLKADFADQYSVHYLMVAAFLRGSTDPPPAEWFLRCDTWRGKCRKDGMVFTVPPGAQQLLVFLAPETGGDFKTLMSAVRGRPGVFVRASQDLNQAAMEHLRLQAYLQAVRHIGDSDPARLKEAAPLLSRSLAIKVDEKCLQKTPTLQAACLMQGQESLIMTDGHGESMTQQLTSGPASDLAMEAGNTPQLKSGYYGPFIGSLLDIARLFDSFHTAKYQYIAALASPSGRELALTLNAPPSFHDPKSVMVAALPPIEASQFPRLRPVDTKDVYCAKKSPLVLTLEGAPPMFAGAYSRSLSLRVTTPSGTQIELPAVPDAAHGGFAVDTAALQSVDLPDSTRGSLHGYWGFEEYNGPGFTLVDAQAQPPRLAPGDESALIVGREDTLHLHVGSAACVSEIALSGSDGKEAKVAWKATRPDEVEARLPLEEAQPGEVAVLIREYGSAQPQRLTLHAYSEAGHLDSFTFHAGDTRGILRGTRLDEVASLELRGLEFIPESLASSAGHDELSMPESGRPTAIDLKQGEKARARVQLKDGRAYEVGVVVEAPKPAASLIGKSVLLASTGEGGTIRLASQDELPQDAQLTFSLRAQVPAGFSRDDRIEVATLDGSFSTTLDRNAGMTLQNRRVAVATLDPDRAFGPSAFGPLRFRVVSASGEGDWQPLATLVRLPLLKAVQCSAGSDTPCQLSGVNLFLIDAVSSDPDFNEPTRIPDGFTADSLAIPRPAHGRLYLKLRDDPTVISEALVEVLTPQSQSQAARQVDGGAPDSAAVSTEALSTGEPPVALPIRDPPAAPAPAAQPAPAAAPAQSPPDTVGPKGGEVSPPPAAAPVTAAQPT